jgi:hypothetical protein
MYELPGRAPPIACAVPKSAFSESNLASLDSPAKNHPRRGFYDFPIHFSLDEITFLIRSGPASSPPT